MTQKILILGSSGELGHKMLQTLSNEKKFDVCGTVRGNSTKKYDIVNKYPLITNVDVNNFNTIESAIDKFEPNVIINAIGIIKQLPEANNAEVSYKVNSVLPHKLALYCNSHGSRVIHISTDCVFDGKKGMYKELDIPNAVDIYGNSKFAGELRDNTNLTIRTSIIGRELFTRHGFLEWFLSNRGKKCDGFEKSVFSGVSTIELSKGIAHILTDHNNLSGLYHLAAKPINKYDLCNLVNSHLDTKLKVKINKVDGEIIDRSLDASRLKEFYSPPSWESMISELMNDPTPYDKIRKHYAI